MKLLLGKPIHSDEKNEKTTWVTVYGLEQARKDVSEYSQGGYGHPVRDAGSDRTESVIPVSFC